jgi:DNA repair photolyase
MYKICVSLVMKIPLKVKGRGSSDNPINRFEGHYVDYQPEDRPEYKTRLFRDDTKNIISFNQSPDVPFEAGLNPYRGCEHGCVYCFARPFHEYLGFSSGLDFETKIMVKYDAPELLKKIFQSPKWKPQVIAMSGITDVYQPIERKLLITRKCLEVFAEFRAPVGIITKNYLITRDIDYLQELSKYNCASVYISITTLDKDLGQKMEPRTSSPTRRLRAIEELSKAGIPVGVNVAPIIPGITDHEIPEILKTSKEAGAQSAGHIILRLPYKVKDLFQNWLDQHYPDRKEKVINRIKSMRDGNLTNSNFGERMKGKGEYYEQINQSFAIHSRRLGLNKRSSRLTTEFFRKAHGDQLKLFD